MRMQPRQQLLDIWRATVRASWDGKGKDWRWGGTHEPNSISDAEQLLCLLVPATQLGDFFGLDNPSETAAPILRVLESLGDSRQIPRTLIDVMTEYYEKYSDEETG